MKRLCAVLLCAVMLIGIFGSCKKSDSKSAGGDKEEIVVASNAVISMLDPQRNNIMVCKMVYYSIFSTLFKYDLVKKEFYGDLVESYTVDSTGLTWNFKLRQGVKFHDGGALTAKDIKFTYERARTSSHQASKMTIMKEITVVDNYNLKIVLNEPSQEFLEVISDPGLSILSEAAISAKGNDGLYVGSGAYSVKELVPEDYCLIVRFDGYFGQKARTKSIRFRKIAENSARIIALQTGEIDVALVPASIDLPRVKEDKKLELIQMPGSRVVYMALNQSKPPFNNLKVRQAIAQGINRQDIITATVDGMGKPGKQIISWSCLMYPENVKGPEYNPGAAKALLAEAGYANGLEFTIMPDSAQWATSAEVMQAQLKQIGVNMKIEMLEPAVATARVDSNDYHILLSSYGFTSSNDIPLRSLFYSTGVFNEAKFTDTVLDKLIDDGLFESNRTKRLDIYRQIDQRIMDSAAWLPLFYPDMFVAIRKGVSGVNWAYHGRHDFTYVYLPL